MTDMAHVLIVDDDVPTREVVRYVLEDMGHTVLEAGDGNTALDVMRASAMPLVVLLDLNMPHSNGLEVLNAVAANEALAMRHRFVLVTASTGTRLRATDQVREALAVPFLLKPFEIDDLLAAVGTEAHRLPSAL